jgi:hypothetical protein
MTGKQKVDPEPAISCATAEAITAYTSTIVDNAIRIPVPFLALPDTRVVSPLFVLSILIIEDAIILSHYAVGVGNMGLALTPHMLLCFAPVPP